MQQSILSKSTETPSPGIQMKQQSPPPMTRAEQHLKGRHSPSSLSPASKRRESFWEDMIVSNRGDRTVDSSTSGSFHRVSSCKQQSYVNSCLHACLNSPPHRRSPPSRPERYPLAVVPERTPPDAKALPLPLFVKTSQSTREIKALLRIA